jgi:heme exporter protein B
VKGFMVLVRRDVRLALRQASDTLLVLVFFVLATVLFPFGVGPEPNVLARIAAGVVWVMALLAAMLSLDRLYQTDYDDGSLDLLLLAPLPLEATVLAKALAHWLTTGLPLIAVAPVLAVMLRLDTAGYPALIGAMVLGTPAISLIGTVGAALAVGARRGGVLLSLLVLPLLVPVLIFGAGAVEAALTGVAAESHLLLLAGMLLVALVLCPWASAAALRQAME